MSDVSRDERLVELLDRLAEDARNGRQADLEAVIRQHPDLETDLRELWATMLIAEDFSSFCGPAADLIPEHAAADLSAGLRTTSDVLPAASCIGDYELLEELGRGGMGVVYRARQKSLGRIVAVKMILRGALASETDVARFRQEAEAAATLSHPHIVQVFEVGEHQGLPYFSMQFVDGSTLARKLSDGPLAGREAVDLLLPVCRGIEEAHRQGLLHRDLKPSNILISRVGQPYVTDFGLAKQIDSTYTLTAESRAAGGLTQSGAILGTPGYMAPEQAAGRRGDIGPATDVYSLGAILYAMLTGRPPFQAANPIDTVMMVLEQEPVPPRTMNPSADADLEMIALKCLQKPADLRYQDVTALAGDLEAWKNHEPVSARSSQLTQVLSRAFRETHHASVLENWGLLWMWHSLVVFGLCLITNGLQWIDADRDSPARWPYLVIWCVGISVWAFIFYGLRRRSGPVTFVERQIVHVWAGSMISSMLLFSVEWQLNLRVLTLSPVISLVSGMVFLVKASLLDGRFYLQAAVLFATAVVMSLIQSSGLPDFSVSLYGLVSSLCFFLPGLKYHRQRGRR